MKAIEIKPGIYWVGAIDWAIRDFHGYITPNGTTYNNYLAIDKDITLFDTVIHEFSKTTIDNIKSLVAPSKIKNIVINNIENDHVTSLADIMALTPDAAIYITEKGRKGLARFFDISKWKINVAAVQEVAFSAWILEGFGEPLHRFPEQLLERRLV